MFIFLQTLLYFSFLKLTLILLSLIRFLYIAFVSSTITYPIPTSTISPFFLFFYTFPCLLPFLPPSYLSSPAFMFSFLKITYSLPFPNITSPSQPLRLTSIFPPSGLSFPSLPLHQSLAAQVQEDNN